jgi:predicted DCC family thiol-disulfide oxidoreductase YuxK
MNIQAGGQSSPVPILLYDGGCQTCSRIARWVHRSARAKAGKPGIIERPVGNNPADLRRLNPALDIWDAYAVVHVIMPDGLMKLGGEAVAEVLRRIPSTKWIAWFCDIRIFGIRPFQKVLNLAYLVLDDIRPLLGCDSCGKAKPWVRPIHRLMKWATAARGHSVKPKAPLHFRPLAVAQPGVAGPSQPPAAATKV